MMVFWYCVVGRCRQNRQLLRQKIVGEQQRLLGKVTGESKCETKEHSSSTFLADDDSLLISEADTGVYLLLACTCPFTF